MDASHVTAAELRGLLDLVSLIADPKRAKAAQELATSLTAQAEAAEGLLADAEQAKQDTQRIAKENEQTGDALTRRLVEVSKREQAAATKAHELDVQSAQVTAAQEELRRRELALKKRADALDGTGQAVTKKLAQAEELMTAAEALRNEYEGKLAELRKLAGG